MERGLFTRKSIWITLFLLIIACNAPAYCDSFAVSSFTFVVPTSISLSRTSQRVLPFETGMGGDSLDEASSTTLRSSMNCQITEAVFALHEHGTLGTIRSWGQALWILQYAPTQVCGWFLPAGTDQTLLSSEREPIRALAIVVLQTVAAD